MSETIRLTRDARGVAVITLARSGQISDLWNPSALYGLGAGVAFSMTSLLIRQASLSFSIDDAMFTAAVTLAYMIVVQTLMTLAMLLYQNAGEFRVIFRRWRPSLFIGLTSVIGSAGWFTAFTLERDHHQPDDAGDNRQPAQQRDQLAKQKQPHEGRDQYFGTYVTTAHGKVTLGKESDQKNRGDDLKEAGRNTVDKKRRVHDRQRHVAVNEQPAEVNSHKRQAKKITDQRRAQWGHIARQVFLTGGTHRLHRRRKQRPEYPALNHRENRAGWKGSWAECREHSPGTLPQTRPC